MTDDKLTQIIEAIAILLQAIGWPLVAVFVVVYFGDSIKRIMKNVSEFTLKAGPTGVEATVKRKIEAAAFLGAASAQKKFPFPDSPPPTEVEDEAHDIAETIDRASHPQVTEQLVTKRVLWVDDRLEENFYEKKCFESLGIQFSFCRDTEEAIEKLKFHQYHAIISDLERPPDETAGYTLLQRMRQAGFYMPYIIYDRAILAQHKSEARQLGANGTTKDPHELFELVLFCLIGNIFVSRSP
jgi:CheY-like chemotaxis protein